MALRTLNYGNYGIFLIMGNAGFCPSAVNKKGTGFLGFVDAPYTKPPVEWASRTWKPRRKAFMLLVLEQIPPGLQTQSKTRNAKCQTPKPETKHSQQPPFEGSCGVSGLWGCGIGLKLGDSFRFRPLCSPHALHVSPTCVQTLRSPKPLNPKPLDP